MTDKNQDNSPADDNSAEIDEFESLSQDEKAAFARIMAEIEEAEGDESLPPQAKEPESPTDPPPSENIKSPDSTEASTPDAPEAAKDDNGDGEALSDDQQAALDQIMAEIDNQKNDSEPSETEAEAPSASNDNDGDNDDTGDGEVLSDDQQAALDQIMAEIEGKKSADPAETEAEDPSISNDNNGDNDDTGDDETLSDDQQAALDQIMAEIDNKKTDTEPAEVALDSVSDEDEPSKDNLSVEEFNNELTELLNPENPTSQEPKEAETVPDSPPEPVNTDGTETDVDTTGDQTKTDDHPNNEFPILKEISVDAEPSDEPSQPSTSEPSRPPAKRRLPLKRVAVVATVVALIGFASVGIYLGYDFYSTQKSEPLLVGNQPSDTQPLGTLPTETPPVGASSDPPPPAASRSETRTPVVAENNSMTTLASQLAFARRQLQQKKAEIEELTEYYQKGIDEERNLLKTRIEQENFKSLDQATKNAKTMLILKSIQRRMTYVEKLKAPLSHVYVAVEELLFLERRAQIYAHLTTYSNGVQTTAFEQEANLKLETHLDDSQKLSIDNFAGTSPSLEVVWTQLQRKPSAVQRSKGPVQAIDPLSAAISKEICGGNYSRKNLLEMLTPKTASCLLNWQGQDLYLNELKTLSPSAAKILAKWQGEWMSLNGLTELSAVSAKELARWKGKRLSLNGLTRLSTQATVNLSEWQGDQIEMVGLTEIGPWKNYGTRLFLSEEMKHRLEGR